MSLRTALVLAAAATVALIGGTAAAATPTHRQATRTCRAFDRTTGDARQVLLITGRSHLTTYGSAQRWACPTSTGRWAKVGSSMTVRFGAGGLTTHPSDWSDATPIGTSIIGAIYGGASRFKTGMPYSKWQSNAGCSSGGSSYNRIENFSGELARGSHGRWSTLVTQINSNPHNVRGRGNCYFIHYDNWNGPTAGCVGFTHMSQLAGTLAWFQSRYHPRLIIRVA